MFFLDHRIEFPPVDLADAYGILAIGGDLSVDRLMLAYNSGIFPWYNQGEPIVWYSPPKRMVLFPGELIISKSMRQVIRNKDFKVTFNGNFKGVITECMQIKRKEQEGTWITNEMLVAYQELHKIGLAKSVEVYKNGALVGGLYGIDLGNIFCGESMFSLENNASKVAFIYLVKKLEREKYSLIDCQVYNEHLASLGAREIPRKEFIKML